MTQINKKQTKKHKVQGTLERQTTLYQGTAGGTEPGGAMALREVESWCKRHPRISLLRGILTPSGTCSSASGTQYSPDPARAEGPSTGPSTGVVDSEVPEVAAVPPGRVAQKRMSRTSVGVVACPIAQAEEISSALSSLWWPIVEDTIASIWFRQPWR